MVDARGGAMRGCRNPSVRIIVPPRKCCMPTRVTCRLVKKEKIFSPPPLVEGEGLAARVLEMGPVGTKFLGPVLLEVPHYASLRGKEREVVVLRSDNGENWYEHPMQATEEAVAEALGSSAEGGLTGKASLGGSTSIMPNGIGSRGSQASVASLWSEHALLYLSLSPFVALSSLEMPSSVLY
ncbi:ankyrin-3 [Elysia marginata]|uniref:Ankyrin-3 n=1 Tax=Elysia marginata TaxID=1093978 RepID=A0AAV4GIS4_9GAST|nr:ankyrin-3 [Elysia marginata]